MLRILSRYCHIAIYTTFIIFTISNKVYAKNLCKTAVQKYLGFAIYQITLCKEAEVKYENIFNNQFSLQIHYQKDSSANFLNNRSIFEIKKHYQINKEKEQFYRQTLKFFPNVKEGDEITLDFNPQNGIKFYYNKNFIGTIIDKDFATQFANIWLHPQSTFKKTRDFLFLPEKQ